MEDPTRTVCGVAAIAVAVVFAWGSASTATAESSVESGRELPETPAEYERFALERDPELREHYQRWRAARSEARAEASSWPQPSVGYRTFIDFWWHDDARALHRGRIGQRFPWPGVLEKAAEPARARAEAARHRFRARALEVVREVRFALVEVARIDEFLAIFRERREIYGDIAEIVDRNVESDRADYGDSLRVSTNRETNGDRIDALRSERRQTVAELREKLDLGAGVELTFDFERGRDPLDVPETSPDAGELIEAARTRHPELEARRAEADARVARAEYARAKRLPWPKLVLGVNSAPIRVPGRDFDRRTALLVDVSVPLPLFTEQYDREREQFERQREAVVARREGTERELAMRVEKSVARIDEKLRRLRRYRDELLPLAEDATEQTLQEIETGEESVTDYLLTFEQQLELETNVSEFRATVARERARLEMLTGGAFEARPDRESPTIEIGDVADEGEADE